MKFKACFLYKPSEFQMDDCQIESEGCGYPHYAAYVPGTRDVGEAEMERTAPLSDARKAELFDNAVAAVLDLYEGGDLYAMLHDSFGLTDREILECRYMTGAELADAGAMGQERAGPAMEPVM